MHEKALCDWVLNSPKQRLVVLQVMNAGRRTSENIRFRAKKLNSHLTRESTKTILKELEQYKLVCSEIKNRRRCYWITNKGWIILGKVQNKEV